MKKLIRLAFMAAAFMAAEYTALAQIAPTVAWDKTFGGSGGDYQYALKQTTDGGYILGGSSASGVSGDKSQVFQGIFDYWAIKVDATGNKIWDKTFGGSAHDGLTDIVEIENGRIILGGRSASGVSSNKTAPSKGSGDYWLVKVDNTGNKIWDKSYGGSGNEEFKVLHRTSDYGFILGGYSASGISGDKSEPSRGSTDFWIIKIDSAGNKQWDKTFGGSSDEILFDLKPTMDGGYILGGLSSSGISGDKTQANRGPINTEDFWLVKIDGMGNKQWDKTFGGAARDEINAIQQTLDGGYIIAGSSLSGQSGDKSQPSKGGYDFWIIKTDALGNIVWDKTIGGSADDDVKGLEIMPDGSYIIGGSSKSNISGDKTQNNVGSPIYRDYWIVKLDISGNKLWDKTIGSGADDACNVMIKTVNNEVVLGGFSSGGIGGNKTQASRGSEDFWIVKLNPTCADLTATISATCGASGTNLNINITGIQPATTGTPSWTLTYTVNGVTQTATGTTNTFSLATNAAVGTVYTLVSIASGTCTNTITGTFTVQAVPSAPTVTPGNSCGSGTVTLSATGAPTGGNYVWYDAATAGTALQTSASGTFTTPGLSSTATYYVAVTNNAGCESPRSPVTATITNLTVTTGPAQTICIGAFPPVQLTGNPTGGTWTGPGVSSSGLFTPPSTSVGTHSLTYTVTQNGCTDSATQTITVTAAPVINAGLNDTVCASAAPFQLTGFSPAGGTWSGTGVSATGLFTPTHGLAGSQTLTYSVTENGCTETSTKLVVIPTPPAQPTISLHSADTLIASTAGSSYEWKYNNIVLPTTTQKLKVTASGTYAVRVKDAVTCASEFSADYTYTVSGRKEDLANQFSLYPNPTSGLLTLELTTTQPTGVTIFNALGQQVLQKTVAKTDKKVQLDLSRVAKGIYLVQVQTERQVVVKKIVVE